MSTITIELCNEDRERLDIIINALREALNGVKPEDLKAAEAPKPEPKKAVEAEKVEAAKQEPKAEEPKTEEVPWQTVTLADLQSKVVQLVSAGKKDETRAIILKYAKSVSEIPEDQRAEVLDKLRELEG